MSSSKEVISAKGTIRIEALKAAALVCRDHGPDAGQSVIDMAARFEKYIQCGRTVIGVGVDCDDD